MEGGGFAWRRVCNFECWRVFCRLCVCMLWMCRHIATHVCVCVCVLRKLNSPGQQLATYMSHILVRFALPEGKITRDEFPLLADKLRQASGVRHVDLAGVGRCFPPLRVNSI